MHESSVAISFGALLAGTMMVIVGQEYNDTLRFNDNIFFYAILPPIIFSAGYNLKRKKFFQHFNYISLFGIIGTLVAFGSFSLLNYTMFEIFPFTKYNPRTGDYHPFKLTL